MGLVAGDARKEKTLLRVVSGLESRRLQASGEWSQSRSPWILTSATGGVAAGASGSLRAVCVLHGRRRCCPGRPPPPKTSMYLWPLSTLRGQQATLESDNKWGDGRLCMHRTWRQRASI